MPVVSEKLLVFSFFSHAISLSTIFSGHRSILRTFYSILLFDKPRACTSHFYECCVYRINQSAYRFARIEALSSALFSPRGATVHRLSSTNAARFDSPVITSFPRRKNDRTRKTNRLLELLGAFIRYDPRRLL